MTQAEKLESEIKRNLDLAKYHQKIEEYSTAKLYITKASAILTGVSICNYGLGESGMKYFNEYVQEHGIIISSCLL